VQSNVLGLPESPVSGATCAILAIISSGCKQGGILMGEIHHAVDGSGVASITIDIS
jgi:hypothetical protein